VGRALSCTARLGGWRQLPLIRLHHSGGDVKSERVGPLNGVANGLAVCLILMCAFAASAQGSKDLSGFSLEELGNIEVTAVSRSPDMLAHVPAAVFVVTQEDIRRSGVTSIPDALRLAPGVLVARLDAAHWAIGIRGFASPLTRSVLVLIDGRAVYDPLFAGTYWDVQDTLLEDIDRIEVVRGPGGTLWGANAINGIINIITKTAAETKGGLVSVQGGSADYGSAGVRLGGGTQNVSYRAYGKAVHRGPAYRATGESRDHWRAERGGFRIDSSSIANRVLTVQGDFYQAQSGAIATSTTYGSPFATSAPYDASLFGGNVLARWSSAGETNTPFQLQVYYDRTHRHEIPVREHRGTLDIDFQQTRKEWSRQELIWGLAYRTTSGRVSAAELTRFVPDSRIDHLSSALLQDTFTLVPERLRVSGGAKLEHNSYSGVELQPSGRVVWTPNATSTVVGSVTRAVRTPSPVETEFTTVNFAGVTQGLGTFVRLQPNPAFISEKLTAYELGYRLQPNSMAYMTVSSFYNQLDDVLSTDLLTPLFETDPWPPHLIVPVQFGNGLQGSSAGAEITTDIRPASWWRVTANYSYLRIALSKKVGGTDVSAEKTNEGGSPRHQWQVRSSVNLPAGWSTEWFLRSVSALATGPVSGYVTSNARIAWQATPRVDLAIVGQDLHQGHHLEWPGGTGGMVEVPRSGYLTVTWKW
jgi:iron complex outermembrane receptor protein